MMAACRVDCRNTLGEGCFWDPRDDCLYWTDIEECRIFRLEVGGSVRVFGLPERAAFILPRQKPGHVVGFASRIVVSDPDFKHFQTLAEIEPDLPQTRVNDAAVDPFGGIVFGTFDERNRQPVASLYRIEPTGQVRHLVGGIAIGNGIAFSPDEGMMYFADTSVGTIRRLRVTAAFAAFEEIEPLAGAEVAPGRPDGATVDEEGHYWSARVWGGCLVRIAPDGRVSDRIDLPAKGPTCVALGEAERTCLFATTLRLRHTSDELTAVPQAGGLYAAQVKVPGVPQRLSLL